MHLVLEKTIPWTVLGKACTNLKRQIALEKTCCLGKGIGQICHSLQRELYGFAECGTGKRQKLLILNRKMMKNIDYILIFWLFDGFIFVFYWFWWFESIGQYLKYWFQISIANIDIRGPLFNILIVINRRCSGFVLVSIQLVAMRVGKHLLWCLFFCLLFQSVNLGLKLVWKRDILVLQISQACKDLHLLVPEWLIFGFCWCLCSGLRKRWWWRQLLLHAPG